MNIKILCKTVRVNVNSLDLHCYSLSLNTPTKTKTKKALQHLQLKGFVAPQETLLSLCRYLYIRTPTATIVMAAIDTAPFHTIFPVASNFIVRVKKKPTKHWSFGQGRNVDCFTTQFLLTALNCVREFPLPNTHDKHCIWSSSKKLAATRATAKPGYTTP